LVFYAHHLGSLADHLLRHKLVATHLLRQIVVVLATIPLQVGNGRAIVLQAKLTVVSSSVIANDTVHRRAYSLPLPQIHIGRLLVTLVIALGRHAVSLAHVCVHYCVVVVLYAARLFCGYIKPSTSHSDR
jgi:hypothetical protein